MSQGWKSICVVAVCACGQSTPGLVRATGVQELGVATTSHSIVGRDGASSRLAWGHSIWAFGDTVMQQNDAEGTNWHYNSFALTDDLGSPVDSTFSERTVDGGALEYFIAPTPEEDAFNAAHHGDSCATPPCGERWAVWPGSMVFDDANDRLVISYALVAPDGEVGGHSFAVWSDPASTPQRSAVSDAAPHGVTLFADSEAMYDEAPAIVDGQLYAFASTKDGLEYHASLGRVPVGQLLERSAWTFWTGSAWSSSPADAQVLFAAGLGFNTFYDAALGAWVAIYAPPFSNNVMVRSAKQLTGPWSDEAVLFVADRHGGDPGTYDAYAHVELTPDDGHTMFVTFSRTNGGGLFGSEIAVMKITLDAP